MKKVCQRTNLNGRLNKWNKMTESSENMRLFIDGDASPVKNEVIEVARNHQLEVVIVTSIDHFTTKEYPDHVRFHYVDKGNDMADFRIVALISAGDLLITQDYGLASLVLPKTRVLHHNGWEYTTGNMDELLMRRFHSAEMRKAGHRTKGPSAFTAEQRNIFQKKLEKVVSETK